MTRPVPDARAHPGLHRRRSLGIRARQVRQLGASGRLGARGVRRVREAEQAAWQELFDLREQALPELEKARQAKTIGKALEARLTVSGPEPRWPRRRRTPTTLRELLNVSQLELARGTDGALAFAVRKADGQKCERCWHWEPSVGTVAEHSTICARCAEAVHVSGLRPA